MAIEQMVVNVDERTRMQKLKTFFTAWCEYYDLRELAPNTTTLQGIDRRMSICEKHISELVREAGN